MFYARRRPALTTTSRPKIGTRTKPTQAASDLHTEIVTGLHGLGLMTATTAQVIEAMSIVYPQGTTGADTGEIIRAIFLHLRSKNSAVNVGRKE